MPPANPTEPLHISVRNVDGEMSPHRLAAPPYRTIILSSLGTVLEYYDFIIFVFFIKILSQLFFPPSMPGWVAQLETIGIYAAGYIARPLGGIVLAHYGDLLGRKKVFLLTIALMVSSSLGVAIIPTYTTLGNAAPIVLLLFRLIQSVAIGGEVPGAWTFVAEHVPRNRVGLACGLTCSGILTGVFLGSLTAIAISTSFSEEDIRSFAWRFPFLLGGFAGILSIFLRQFLSETPVFEELRKTKALATKWPLQIVIKCHLRGLGISFVVGSFLTACLVIIFLLTPTLLQTIYSVNPITALKANLVASGVLVVSSVLAGLLVDRIGGGWHLLVGSILLGVATFLLYTEILYHPNWLPWLYALVGLCSGVFVAVPYIMINSFPPPVRFSGIATSYNCASAIVGGMTPVVVTYSIRANPMAHMYCVVVVCALGALTGALLIGRPESKS